MKRTACIMALLSGWTPLAFAANQAGKTMKAMETLLLLIGSYSGSWDFFGIDAQGAVVKKYSMTDTAQASDPKVQGARAFVTVRDQMQVQGREFAVEFHEGFFVKPDGSVGERYFEMYGQTVVEYPLGERAWSYQTPVRPQELEQMGFRRADVVSAVHTTVKTEVVNGRTETQMVTRLTTVQWKDSAAHVKALQFVSMSGVHTRELPPTPDR